MKNKAPAPESVKAAIDRGLERLRTIQRRDFLDVELQCATLQAALAAGVPEQIVEAMGGLNDLDYELTDNECFGPLSELLTKLGIYDDEAWVWRKEKSEKKDDEGE
jgi:hypothetical protein